MTMQTYAYTCYFLLFYSLFIYLLVRPDVSLSTDPLVSSLRLDLNLLPHLVLLYCSLLIVPVLLFSHPIVLVVYITC